MLTEFESLRSVTLITIESLDKENLGNSTDADYDAASAIMADLHARKAGCAFELLQIWLYTPTADLKEERLFASRINEMGIYEQWGCEKDEGPIPDLVSGEGAQGEEGEET